MAVGSGTLTWKQLATGVWRRQREHHLVSRAGELAYFFLLALFPLILFIVSIAGAALGSAAELRAELVSWLSEIMPESASSLVRAVVEQTASRSGSGKAAIGLALALWSASAGMSAVMRTMNAAFEAKETRSFWHRRATALGLTLAVGALTILAVALIAFGGRIARWIGAAMGARSWLVLFWDVAQWPLALLFVTVVFAMIYERAPDRPRRWRWVSPGAVLGVAIWLAASIALRFYVSHFGHYSATYGSLGGVIILMLWFYVTGLALLLGAEIDAEIQHPRPERAKPRLEPVG